MRPRISYFKCLHTNRPAADVTSPPPPQSPTPAPPSSDARLSSVLEGGRGSCVALSLLYLAVCARLGLELAVRVLRDEGGSYYCVAWPAGAPLQAGGVRCVVDVYGRGALLTVDEVGGRGLMALLGGDGLELGREVQHQV